MKGRASRRSATNVNLKNVNDECVLANCDECYDEREPGAIREYNEEPDLVWGQAKLPGGSDI